MLIIFEQSPQTCQSTIAQYNSQSAIYKKVGCFVEVLANSGV
jgi:hypothetical protein